MCFGKGVVEFEGFGFGREREGWGDDDG